MNKICLSQNNFDRLLELALNNCQKSDKKIPINKPINKPINQISFMANPTTNCGVGVRIGRDMCKCGENAIFDFDKNICVCMSGYELDNKLRNCVMHYPSLDDYNTMKPKK